MPNSRTAFTRTTPPHIALLLRKMREELKMRGASGRWEISPATLQALRDERRRCDRGFDFTFDERTILSLPLSVDEKMTEPWRLVAIR